MSMRFGELKIGVLVYGVLVGVNAYGQRAFDEFIFDKFFDTPIEYNSIPIQINEKSDVEIVIDTKLEINPVRNSIYGNNAVAWQGDLDTNNRREENWRNANYSFLRYPGGNWSNLFFWDGQLPTSIRNESVANGKVSNLKSGTAKWLLGTDEYPSLLDYTKSEGIISVNLGYAFYGEGNDRVATAADYAAKWVRDFNIDKQLGIKYWELGNENYGSWQAGFDLASPVEYAQACVEFSKKMKTVDPSIKLGIVLYHDYGGSNNKPQGVNWNEQVLPIVQDIMDFAIIHHYPHPNRDRNLISEEEIYEAVSTVEETQLMLRDLTKKYTSKPAGYFPIAVTEFNARTGVRELSRTNVLFTSLMLGEYAKHEDYSAVMQWDLYNGYDEYGGSHSAVALRDPFMNDGDITPSSYVYYYMHKYFGDQLVKSVANQSKLKTYATTFSSGEIGLMLVNTGNVDLNASIDLGEIEKGERMYWYTLEGDESDFDRTVYINGLGPNTNFNIGQLYVAEDTAIVATTFEENGVGGPQDYESILPFSSEISTLEQITFKSPKYSVSYLVFETDIIDGLNKTRGQGLNLYPNPTNNIVVMGKELEYSVYDMLGKEVKSGVGSSLNLSGLQSGIYLIETEDGMARVIKK